MNYNAWEFKWSLKYNVSVHLAILSVAIVYFRLSNAIIGQIEKGVFFSSSSETFRISFPNSTNSSSSPFLSVNDYNWVQNTNHDISNKQQIICIYIINVQSQHQPVEFSHFIMNNHIHLFNSVFESNVRSMKNKFWQFC